MIQFNDTDLQIICFGELPEDHFYCLVDKRVAGDGLDVEKMRLMNPRSFDLQLREMGCLVMLTGREVDELASRGDLEPDELHRSIYELSSDEGLLPA